MNADPVKAKGLFLQALKCSSAQERDSLLNAVCGDDQALRQHVDILIEAHEHAGTFLEKGALAASPTTNQPVVERLGTQIGPYRLLQQIGEGGMGTVYMAEQSQPVQRNVALKVIKPGMDSRQVIARFDAEKHALGLMDHVNIARVLDAGTTEQGRPYFVMELVHGVPITNYCDDNRLTLRQRLELFVPVCQAIQHAHQKGIIHRDIKPSNVMVTLFNGKPVPKVIDFGVAKAMGQQLTDKTLFTEFAQMIGTPLYMSPEQAELSSNDIDTRSDVYSLGVLLYELLTGSTPVSKEQLKQAAFDEIRRVIREDDPQKPSTRISTAEAAPSIAAQRHTEPAKLTRLVRGELDWIVMKALEKDRNRRYETSSSFAADVRRYLNDEPVRACPPSAAYRLRKFVRRNKGPVLAAAVVALALVAGIIGTTWSMLRATDAEAVAVSEAKQKQNALQDKEEALADAKDKLCLSLYEQARARRFTHQMGQRLESLDAVVKAAAIRSDERLRDEAIAAMALPDVLRQLDLACQVSSSPPMVLRRPVPAVGACQRKRCHQCLQYSGQPRNTEHRRTSDQVWFRLDRQVQPRWPVPSHARIRQCSAARVACSRRKSDIARGIASNLGVGFQPGQPASGSRSTRLGHPLRLGDRPGTQPLAIARYGGSIFTGLSRGQPPVGRRLSQLIGFCLRLRCNHRGTRHQPHGR